MRQRTKLILSITLALLHSLIGIGLGANLKGQRDRVAYISFQPSNLDIYLFAQQGKTPKRLTDYQGLDYDPVVSPDGRWLVFCSERRGNPDLYVLDLKRGGTPRLLIDNEQLEDQTAFSADGKFIFFVSTYSGNADVYRMPFRPDRTQSMKNAENLTHHPGADLRPAISPDGRIIAFSSDRELPVTAPAPITRIRSGDIWTLNLIDNTLRRLTHMAGTGWNGSPKWSLDGRQIVFYSSQFGSQFRPPLQIFVRSGQPSRIMIMDADGANAHAVTPWEAAALSPDFLPDGRIIYSRKNKQRDEIVSINTDGAGLRIETDKSDDSYWAPTPGPSPGSFVAYGTGDFVQSSEINLVDMMGECGIELAHTPILRWVQRYVPEFEKRWNRYARSVGGSWRCDETYINVKGRWTYMYRAVDKQGSGNLGSPFSRGAEPREPFFNST